jgi:hypothetical protein
VQTRPQPAAFWATQPEGPFAPQHQRRRLGLAASSAPRDPVLFQPDPEPMPPYARADAALAAAVTHGDFAYAAKIFSSALWSWRDVSSSHRFLAVQVRDNPADTSTLLAAFELIDSLSMLELELSQQRRVYWEAIRATTVALSRCSTFADGTSTWWLAQYANTQHRAHIVKQLSPPPLQEWLNEIPLAVLKLHEPKVKHAALALTSSVSVSPSTLADLAVAVAV